VLYDQLTPVQVKQLSDAVNALSEPLSQLTAAVV
jgi:iron uptake system component EfeO